MTGPPIAAAFTLAGPSRPGEHPRNQIDVDGVGVSQMRDIRFGDDSDVLSVGDEPVTLPSGYRRVE